MKGNVIIPVWVFDYISHLPSYDQSDALQAIITKVLGNGLELDSPIEILIDANVGVTGEEESPEKP